ncbi:MAG: hypothetical protein ACC608_01540 [Anaerofustis sp.]
MDIGKSIEGTVFEKARNEYFRNCPSEKEKDDMIMKILFVLLSR